MVFVVWHELVVQCVDEVCVCEVGLEVHDDGLLHDIVRDNVHDVCWSEGGMVRFEVDAKERDEIPSIFGHKGHMIVDDLLELLYGIADGDLRIMSLNIEVICFP